jgi:hypothetical protein
MSLEGGIYPEGNMCFLGNVRFGTILLRSAYEWQCHGSNKTSIFSNPYAAAT